MAKIFKFALKVALLMSPKVQNSVVAISVSSAKNCKNITPAPKNAPSPMPKSTSDAIAKKRAKNIITQMQEKAEIKAEISIDKNGISCKNIM